MTKKHELVAELPLEPDIISNYLEHGPESISDGDYNELIMRMTVVMPDVFLKVLDKASEDDKLRGEIFNKLSKAVSQVITSNDALAQKAIDNDIESATLLRKQIEALIADGKISSEECKFCLLELRKYSDRINDRAERTQQENKKLISRYQLEEEGLQRKSSIGSTIIGGAAGLLTGFGIGWVLHNIFFNSNDDN